MKLIRFIILIIINLCFVRIISYAAETSNFSINKGEDRIIFNHGYKYKKYDNDKYVLNKDTLEEEHDSFTFQIKDNNQNIAKISNKEIKMTQDNNYYYFDFKIFYDAKDVMFNEEEINGNGTLFLSNEPISKISYEYITSHAGSIIGEQKYTYNNNGVLVNKNIEKNIKPLFSYMQSLNLTLNNYTGAQKMTMSKEGYTPIDNVVDNKSPGLLYCTLKFPFEDYFTGTKKLGYNFNEMNYDLNTDMAENDVLKDLNGLDYITSNILWTKGQQNLLMPQKLDYEPIISVKNNKDSSKTYWNNRIEGKIKIKKEDINNYRYINMYCFDVTGTSETNDYYNNDKIEYNSGQAKGSFDPSNEAEYSSSWIFTSPVINYNAKSILSSETIDLLSYINCDHLWTYQFNGNKNKHEMYCSKCEWNNYEDHNLIYEYDGIENNACKCGYISKIHYSYRENGETYLSKIYDSFSDIDEIDIKIKDNYEIVKIEKYEKQYEDDKNLNLSKTNTKIKDVFVGEINKINDKTSLYSTLYNIITKPKNGSGSLNLQPITNETEETPLFGAIPLTGSATEVKVSEHTSNSSSESGEETLTITYSENPNYIASYNINNITMTQDNNNYYFNYDIDYKNASLNYDETKSVGTYTETGRTSGTDDIYQITNGGNLILSTTNINKLVYLYNYSYSKWYDNKNNGNLSKSGVKKEITIQENGITNTYKYNLDYGNTTTTPTKEYNYASQLNITNLSKTGAYPVADDTSREYNYNIPATTTKKLILSNNDCVFSNTQVIRDDSVDYYKYNYTGNITIPKTKISEMKYLKLNAPRAVLVSHTETFQEFILDTQTGKSNYNKRYATVVGTSIDLSPYTNCTHTWKTKQILNKTQHIIYCSKCLLEKTENHTYQYEYDGLTNNLCICGLNKNVNHHFIYDSDKLNDKIVKLVASSSCTTYANPTKTGYIFKNYEKYYKYFEDMINPVFSTTATKLTETLIGTITTLPTMSDSFSQIFKAQYDPIKYNVVFKANSNLGFNVSLTGISNLSNAKYDTEYNNPSVSQTGYTFKGWSLTSGSSTVNIKSTDKIKNLTTTNGTTLNAFPVFEKNKYTFKFATQSNISKINIAQNIANLVCEYGTKYNLPDNIEITGYIFKGWTLTKGSATINFSPNAEINNYTSINNKEYILYPVYNPIKYNVVFKANSNLDFNISLTSISNLNNISYDTEHNIPTASHIGYTFKGWSLTSGSSTINLKTTDKIKNLTTVNGKTINLYPVFDKNKYIFKFATQSNINKIIITQNIANLSCEYGTKYNLPDNIEVIGYIFNGWTKTKGSSNIDFSPKAEIFNYTAINNQSIMLYPVYEAIKYNVIFNKESNLGFDINLTSIDNLKDIEYDKSYDVPIASYAGYTFIGWSLTEGSSMVNIKITDKIENLTTVNGKTINLYPIFEVNKYVFKYATQSNIDKIIITEEIEDLNCEYDKKYNLSNNVKVTGYNFKGWTLTKESNNIDFESNKEIYNYTPIDNNVITIYPVYEPIKYIIIYSNDNVKELNINGNIENQYIYYDEPQKLKKNINVMGYKFVGWSLKATSSEINFKPEQELLNYTTIDNKEITVYPVYKTYSYTFKFNNENNMNKYIVASISNMVCEVDKKYNLPNNIDIEGYNFKGWTLTKGSGDINFVPNEEIYNYNIELLYDNMEINLYPIYEPIKYIFVLATESNIIDINLGNKQKNVEFIYDKSKRIDNIDIVKGYNFKGWSLTKGSDNIDIEPYQFILNYTNIDKKGIILYPVYDYKKLKIEYITNIGYYDNKKQIATMSYTTQTLDSFEYPKIKAEAKYDRKGNIISSKYLEFNKYIDTKTNKAFTSFEDFKNYIFNRNIDNDIITIMYNGAVKTKYYGDGGDSGGGSTGYIGSIKIDPAVPIIDKTNDIYNLNSGNENVIEIYPIDDIKKILVPQIPQVSQIQIAPTTYTNNYNAVISKETKKVIEEKKETEESITSSEKEQNDEEEIVEEETDIQGMTLSPYDEFFLKYGVHIATTSYLVNHHIYNIKEATRIQKILGFIWDYKIIVIPLFLLLLATIIYYYYRVFILKKIEKGDIVYGNRKSNKKTKNINSK